MEEVLVLIDTELHVTYMNKAAKEAIGIEEEDYIGRHFFDELEYWVIHGDRNHTIVHEVLQSRMPQKGLIRQTEDGRTLSVNVVPVSVGSKLRGVLITGEDVTHLVAMEQELDMAFALTLPNSKVEHRLKLIPEFRDEYDRKTKRITVKGIVVDGGYRHVVNCLKLFSQLTAKGVTQLIGIDKDALVQAFVFHDLGKSQPDLHIGDIVDPKVAFENGKLHAERSADIAKYHYQLDDNVVSIIRYHHHGEDELPDDFPHYLLPMFRVFQIIDGSSAAITRGGVEITFEVKDCVIQVHEINHRPQYHGTRQINLYTGHSQWLPLEEAPPGE